MPNNEARVNKQYGGDDIWQKIESGLKLAGKDLDSLTLDDLAPIAEVHTSGRLTLCSMSAVA